MVFFNCNACGEALKKNQVEKHTYRCRDCQVLSCVDCSKDFWGNDYQLHTKCMTENEKYCGPGYVAKVNKGEVKQEKWIEKVQNAIEQSTSDPKLRGLLQRLQDYPNIPRKKAKFENFLKNSMRILSPFLITQVWDLLMVQTATAETAEKTAEKSGETTGETASNASSEPQSVAVMAPSAAMMADCTKTSENNSNTNGVDSGDENQNVKLSKREKKEERKKKNKKEKKDKQVLENSEENVKPGKKRKHEDLEDDTEVEVMKKRKKKKKRVDEDKESSAKDSVDVSKEDGRLNDTLVSESPKKNDRFSWGSTITALLEKKGDISYKKLRRKIMQEFAARDGANFKEESLSLKFDKKLSKLSHIVIADGRVSLKS